MKSMSAFASSKQQRRDLLQRFRDDAEAGHLGACVHPKAVDMRKFVTEIALIPRFPGASAVAREQGEAADAQSLRVAFDAPA